MKMHWIPVASSPELFEVLFDRFMAGEPPSRHEVLDEEEQQGVYSYLLGEAFFEQGLPQWWPGGLEIQIADDPETVDRLTLALFQGLNHMGGRGFESWPPPAHPRGEENSESVELLLEGLAPVGPGGRVRVIQTGSGIVRVSVAVRPTAPPTPTLWLTPTFLESQLFPALSLLNNDGLEKRVAYGYHEASIHMQQRYISAAIVIAVSQVEAPRWQTLFVQPVTASSGPQPPFQSTGRHTPNAGPENFDNCQ